MLLLNFSAAKQNKSAQSNMDVNIADKEGACQLCRRQLLHGDTQADNNVGAQNMLQFCHSLRSTPKTFIG